eukprot:7707073-Pyramimonas_sp.AAC.1
MLAAFGERRPLAARGRQLAFGSFRDGASFSAAVAAPRSFAEAEGLRLSSRASLAMAAPTGARVRRAN